jgi:hypothetical protein
MSAMKKLAHHKKAKGGKVKEQIYNAQGSHEVHEAEDTKDGFKHGGVKKKKAGGHAEGHKAKHHLGKHKRGGCAKASMGGAYSNAHKVTEHSNKGEGEAHEQEPGISEYDKK